MTQEEKAKRYDEAIEIAKDYYKANLRLDNVDENLVLEDLFPELKESEDEKIRKALINFFDGWGDKTWDSGIKYSEVVAWLEKQKPLDEEKVLIGARKDVALSIMNYLDDNTKGMCLSNMECEDLENAVIDSDWGKVYRYMQKKLEKQGEQKSAGEYNIIGISSKNAQGKLGEMIKNLKPADKVEPKFKVGDWIVQENIGVYKVIEICESWYEIIDGEDNHYSISFDNEHMCRLWDITKDAREGDMLQLGEVTAIFKKFIGNANCICYCSVFNGEFDTSSQDDADSYGCHNAIPATKEQRAILMKAMADAGYTFDFDKKELKEINQSSAEKPEPKFKVGGWITDGKALLCIIKFETDYGYELKAIDGEVFHFVSSDLVEANYHLWTIKDAKDGDVLATLYGILIFKEFLKNDGGISYCHYAFGAGNPQFIWSEDKNWYFGKEAIIHPATKEQRDLLFQKMKEAGYEWDAEKKELKKIEQNPAWGEEDEHWRQKVIDFMKHPDLIKATPTLAKDTIDWVKGLKDKYTWKPSDEQIERLKGIINSLPHQEVLYSLYQDLKKLKE